MESPGTGELPQSSVDDATRKQRISSDTQRGVKNWYVAEYHSGRAGWTEDTDSSCSNHWDEIRRHE